MKTASFDTLETNCKFVLVTGGVLSGLGKGIITSSTGRILRSYGFEVTVIKIDPYINIDAGTMNPFEHGEVFVLDDGGEVDLDMGNYERYLDIDLSSDNSITTGKIYDKIIKKERKGEYLGKTVQVVPHVANEIQDWIHDVSQRTMNGFTKKPDLCIIELGGTVGDIESMPFIEALRQFQFRVGRSNIAVIHVSLVPVLNSNEQKTKPIQHSVRELRALGLNPDIIICRSTQYINDETRKKISSFCHVPFESVLSVQNVDNIYRVPQILFDQNLFGLLTDVLSLPKRDNCTLHEWLKVADDIKTNDKCNGDDDKNTISITGNSSDDNLRIVIVGKYTGLMDSYLCVISALQHASSYIKKGITLNWVEASHLENEKSTEFASSLSMLNNANAILVPGGFGDRGIEGKIFAAKFSREKNIPYLGICLGLQISVIEVARNILGWKDANSIEFDSKTSHPVVIFMPEISKTHMGGTMRLGKRRTFFTDFNSISYKINKKLRHPPSSSDNSQAFLFIDERHRHRYEVNPALIDSLNSTSLNFVAQDETGQRQEIIELSGHPFYVATQFHPEFLSRPNKPSPFFVGFLLAAANILDQSI